MFQDGQDRGISPASRTRRNPNGPAERGACSRSSTAVAATRGGFQSLPTAMPVTAAHAGRHPTSNKGGDNTVAVHPCPDGSARLPLHPLLARQFQALFNSLFKVLFILPSRYFFAIGPSHIFSLGWDLPPNWGCIPKQPDSWTTPRCAAGSGGRRGCHPLRRPLPGNLHTARCRGCLSRLQFREQHSPRIFSLGYSRFARRYQGNPRWFLFLRLVICLNWAGAPARPEIKRQGPTYLHSSRPTPPTASPPQADGSERKAATTQTGGTTLRAVFRETKTTTHKRVLEGNNRAERNAPLWAAAPTGPLGMLSNSLPL